MVKGSVLLGALLLIAATSVVSGFQPLRCTVCRQARHLAHCDEIEVCDASHELCFVEKMVDGEGVTHINAGCRNKTECDSTGCFGESQGSRVAHRVRRAGGNTVPAARLCHHCCDSDYCNMYGCPDSFNVDLISGKRCFSCETIHDADHCRKTVNCGEDEVCFIQRMSLTSNGWYRSGCVSKPMCAMLNDIHTNDGSGANEDWPSFCCNSHMCNGHMQVEKAPPSRTSVNYKCPVNNSPVIAAPHSGHTGGAGPKCFTCKDVTSLHTCNHIEYCEHDEICYAEMAVSSNETVYTLGCAKKAMCTLLSQIKQANRVRRGVHVTKWSECCHGDMCNGKIGGKEPKVTAPPCEDFSTACKLYDPAFICEGGTEAWASVNCRAYCGLCSGQQNTPSTTEAPIEPETTTTKPTTEPTTTTKPTTERAKLTTKPTKPPCEDYFPTCTLYDRGYICEGSNEAWSRVNCRKYCGYCSEIPRTTTVGPCKDLIDTCSMYDPAYLCEGENEAWGRINCRDYCGLCDSPHRIARNIPAIPKP